MKIMASIPVERVQLSPVSFTYRHETMEVEVVRVLRYRIDHFRLRHRYEADVRRPACTAGEYRDYGGGDDAGTIRVSACRLANQKWKPPVFPDGVNVVEVS